MLKLFVIILILAVQSPTLSIASSGPGIKDIQTRHCLNAPTREFLLICGLRKWYLIGNEITPGNNSIQITVSAGIPVQSLDVFIDNQYKTQLSRINSGFSGEIVISSLPPGDHTLVLTIDNPSKALFTWQFQRSHPYYALLTTDWDSSDSKDSILKRHLELHQNNPSLKITHFLGPYTFTDPKVSPARMAYLANWMLSLKNSYQDEIGLHIHPFCNFVNTVPGVDCRLKPSDTYNRGDPSGYTVLSAAYSEAEFLRLLKAADNLFTKHGLQKPVSFRTGSWAANAGTLKALAEDGFIADSSANNWLRIKNESEHDGNGMLYKWNRKHWHAINDRSQPYFPSQTSPMQAGRPEIPILEVPDNGSLVDYVTGDEMISIFTSNWLGKALSNPKTFVFGFHPVSYDNNFHKRIKKILRHIDRYLAMNDGGPVVYETLGRITKIFTTSNTIKVND